MLMFIQRVLRALCLLLLASCSPAPRQWESQEIATQSSCFNGDRLLLGPDTNYSHSELELLRSPSGTRLYINLLFLGARPCQENPERTEVQVSFDEGEPLIIYPFLLAGGQRLLFSGEDADFLIQSLLDGKSFTIQIGRSSLKVIPDNFSKLYEDKKKDD